MKKRSLFLIPLAIFLGACSATGYYPRESSGGYSEIRVNPDKFVVTFNGNGRTHSDTVMKYALLRASELTLQNGYNYFVITSKEDKTSSYAYTDTYERVSGSADAHKGSKDSRASASETVSSSTHSGTVVKPGLTLHIKCFSDKPQSEEAIDARFYWDANKE